MCFRCLNTFNTEKSLASHHEYCKSHEAIKIELPENWSKISFQNHNRSMRVPFIVYAILNPSHHSCQHVNQTLTRATPNGIRNRPPQRILLSHKMFWRYTLFTRTSYFCKRKWWWWCCTNIYSHTGKEYQRHL